VGVGADLVVGLGAGLTALIVFRVVLARRSAATALMPDPTAWMGAGLGAGVGAGVEAGVGARVGAGVGAEVGFIFGGRRFLLGLGAGAAVNVTPGGKQSKSGAASEAISRRNKKHVEELKYGLKYNGFACLLLACLAALQHPVQRR